ncbi:MAG: methionyl-tRNA formyltransferase [Clostridiales bacterium]|nr:methionyl-tRNA formyltransferase [Clostridiales bacterium]
MKVLFMGTPDFAVSTLKAIIEAGHEVIGVVTQPDKPVGRGKKIRFSPVKEEALLHDIPVFQPRKVRDPEVVKELSGLGADVGVVVAFGQILPKSLLDAPKYGCLNVHASLLPAYRGAAPIQWAILNGDEETGVTIMQMDAGLDTGDILTKETVKIESDETGGSLHDKLSEVGGRLLVKTLALTEQGKLEPVKQGETTTEYASMLTKELGHIDWNRDALEIDRKVRGLSPWPSAYTRVNGKTFKIWSSEVVEGDGSAPGTIIQKDRGKLVIACGSGALSLREVQMEGKKRMGIEDFLRGCGEIALE